MSSVKCIIHLDGKSLDISEAVTNTKVIYGKNQPFLHVEVSISRYLFDSASFWNTKGMSSCPKPIQNSTIVDIETYGGTYNGLIYTQTLNPSDGTYVLMCYSKAYLMKTTTLQNLLGNIAWCGNTAMAEENGVLFYYNGEPLCHISSGKLILNGWAKDGQIFGAIQVISASKSAREGKDGDAICSLGTLRMLIPIYDKDSAPGTILSLSDEKFETVEIDGAKYTTVANAKPNVIYASILFQYSYPALKVTPNYSLIVDQTSHHPLTVVQTAYDKNTQDYTTVQADNLFFLQYFRGVEYICGEADSIYAWLTNKFGYKYEDIIIDKSSYYKTSQEIIEKPSYTLEQIKGCKETGRTLYQGVDTFCKISPDFNCYETIIDIGLLTNRTAIFADKAYFAGFQSDCYDEDTVQTSLLDKLSLTYDESENGIQYKFHDSGLVSANLASNVIHDDQGSTYLITEQKVVSDNAQILVNIEDVSTTIAHDPLEFKLSADSVYGSAVMISQVAFNSLVRNYAPSDMIGFEISELNEDADIENITTTIYIESNELPSASSEYVNDNYYLPMGKDAKVKKCSYKSGIYYWEKPTLNKGDIIKVITSLRPYYMVYDGSKWNQYGSSNIIPKQTITFPPNTLCSKLYDERSGLEMDNVPLAYVVMQWPDCISTYFFGESLFQDTEQTIAELQSAKSKAITSTSIGQSINNSKSDIVISGTAESELELSGEDAPKTGIYIGKNESSGTQSIVGYSGGYKQASFSSNGEVSSGTVYYASLRQGNPTLEAGDSVIMDKNGFKTRSWNLYNTGSPQYINGNDGYWKTQCEVNTKGEMIAGGGSVELSSKGLLTRDAEDKITYQLNNGGLTYKDRPIIDTSTDKIIMDMDGAYISGNMQAISITLPYVKIDDTGLKTYSKYFIDTENKNQYFYYRPELGETDETYLQCSVGTNGVITAGAGSVVLDASGMTTYKWDNAERTSRTAQCTVDTSGNITAGGGAIVINREGMVTYNDNAPQCTIGTNGIITAGGGNTRLSALGLETYNEDGEKVCYVDTDGNIVGLTISATDIKSGTLDISNGHVIIDENGLRSYNNADPKQLQCSIGTDGKITAGAGAIKLSSEGLKTYSGNVVQCSIGTDGIITAGKTKLDASGLSTYNSRGEKVCSVDSEGNIVGVKVIADNIQSGTLDISNGHVIIDQQGLRTYDNSSPTKQLQCSVGTDGKITAGAGSIKISAEGLKTYNNNALQCSVGTDGLITAGGNAVMMGERGITVASYNFQEVKGTYASPLTDAVVISPSSAIQIFNVNTLVYIDNNVTSLVLTYNMGKYHREGADIYYSEMGSGYWSELPAGFSTITWNTITIAGAKISKSFCLNVVYKERGDVSTFTIVRISDFDSDPIKSTNSKIVIDGAGFSTYNLLGDRVTYVDNAGNISGVSVSANKITAGTIDANKISVINLNASNITSGTIDANNIEVKNINANYIKYGYLDGERIKADSITSEQISSDYVYAGDITATQIKSGTLDISNGKVKIGADGLKTYDDNATEQCSVGTDGAFKAGTNVSLNSSGVTINTSDNSTITLNEDGIVGSTISGTDTIYSAIINTKDGRVAFGNANSLKFNISSTGIAFYPKSAKILKDGQINGVASAYIDASSGKIYGLGVDSVTTSTISPEAVTDDKIQNLNVSKLVAGDIKAKFNIGAEGAVSAGNGIVTMDFNGLTTYLNNTPSAPKVCQVTTDGAFASYNPSGNLVSELDNDGVKAYTIAGTDSVLTAQLDNEGVKSYIDINSTSERSTLGTYDLSTKLNLFKISAVKDENQSYINLKVPTDSEIKAKYSDMDNSIFRISKRYYDNATIPTTDDDVMMTDRWFLSSVASGFEDEQGLEDVQSDQAGYYTSSEGIITTYNYNTIFNKMKSGAVLCPKYNESISNNQFFDMNVSTTSIKGYTYYNGRNIKFKIDIKSMYGTSGGIVSANITTLEGKSFSSVVSIPSSGTITISGIPDYSNISSIKLRFMGSGAVINGHHVGVAVQISKMYITYDKLIGGSDIQLKDEEVDIYGKLRIEGILDLDLKSLESNSSTIDSLQKIFRYVTKANYNELANTITSYAYIPTYVNAESYENILIQVAVVPYTSNASSVAINWKRRFISSNYFATSSFILVSDSLSSVLPTTSIYGIKNNGLSILVSPTMTTSKGRIVCIAYGRGSP